MKRYTDSSKQHKIKYIYESCYAVMAYTAGKYLSDAAMSRMPFTMPF